MPRLPLNPFLPPKIHNSAHLNALFLKKVENKTVSRQDFKRRSRKVQMTMPGSGPNENYREKGIDLKKWVEKQVQ